MTAAEKFAKFLKKKVLTVFSTESTDEQRQPGVLLQNGKIFNLKLDGEKFCKEE